MIDPKELIEECKSHLRDNTTHNQQYKTDIRKLITALERALSLGVVVGRSEQLKCYHENHEWKSDGDGGNLKYCNDCKCYV